MTAPVPGKKPIPMINKGDPALPVEGLEVAPPSAIRLQNVPTIEQWRRYDRSIFGRMIMPDGSTSDDTVRVSGLLVKLNVKDGWVAMEDGRYFRLGNRAYAGT